MKTTSKTAFGAMIAALCVTLMLSTTIIPFLSYAIPMIAGAMIMLIVIECDKLWAFFVYICVSILSLLVVPDKMASLAFLVYFGYYPILKAILESKTNIVVEKIIKYVHINVVVLLSFFLALNFFGIDTEGIEFIEPFINKWYIYPILATFSSFFFTLYDITLSKVVLLYIKKYRKKFRRIFK